MLSEAIKQEFKEYLTKFSEIFQNNPTPVIMTALKDEINNKNITRQQVIECWNYILNAQGPIEKVSDNKYEIYDVSNFMDETTGSSSDFIHTVTLTDNEDKASVFMKFYFVFYCLVNGVRSNEYKLTERGRS